MIGRQHRICLVGGIILSLFTFHLSTFAQDYSRMTERTIMGTARYVGMCGAMSAIGGDPSAVRDNPAGLGLYRRSELMLTLDYANDYTRQFGSPDGARTHIVMLPHASWVLNLPTGSPDETGILSHNVMFSYHRVHSYARTITATDEGAPSLATVFANTGIDFGIPYCADRQTAKSGLLLKEGGYSNEYALDWAMNISNRWYLGLGLRVQSYTLNSEATYTESFDHYTPDGIVYSNINSTTLLLTGASFNVAAGVLYRPLSWLRLGFAVQTPSLGSLSTSTKGSWTAQTDTFCVHLALPLGNTKADFHMPLRTSTSVAFQVGYYALIGLQYDYNHQSGEQDIHSLRAGFEVIPVPGFYIKGGYAYESTFKKYGIAVPVDPTLDRQNAYFRNFRRSQYASIALGYRGKSFIVQAAYQFRWQGLNLYAHENTLPYDIRTRTHRVVLTLGWHRN